MKSLILLLLIVWQVSVFGQTLYVPGSTGGITSSSNSNVGIGLSLPPSKLSVNGDFQITNASIPMGLMTEVGGYTPLLNMSINFREPDKTNSYRGAAFRIDSRNNVPLFQWLSRAAGSSTESLLMGMMESGFVGLGTGTPSMHVHVSHPNMSGPVGILLENYDGVANSSATVQLKTGASGNVWQTFARNGDMFMGIANVADYMVLKAGGNVGIGTSSPDAKLAVNGTVHATEVKVTATVPGPDYVFENSYRLLSLKEVKAYIDSNKHLPEVPSAKVIEENGVNVGEMNLLLLKKVEELTLHAIHQEEEMSRLKDQINYLMSKK